MSAVMGLNEARAILKGQHGSIDRLGPEYVRHAYAAATLFDHYRENPQLLRPFTLASSAAVGDAGVAGDVVGDVDWRTAADELQGANAMAKGGWMSWRDASAVGVPAGNASPGGITPGAHATGRAGSRLVQKLPHSGFYISQSYDADGEPFVGLFEGPDPNVARSATMQTEVQDRQVRAMREYQDSVTRTRLQTMNRANREFWQKNQRA